MAIQIILSFFLLFALSRVLLQMRKSNLTLQSFFFWAGVFLAAFVGILDPKITGRLAFLLGIGRGADVVTYVSIALLFYLVFRLSIAIEDLRHEITELVRKLSLPPSSKRGKKP